MGLVTPNYASRSYSGTAVPTTLSSDLTSTATTILLNSLTNWTEADTGAPLGTSGGFVIAIDYGLANEEKVYVPKGGLSGTTIQNSTNGNVIRQYDGDTGAPKQHSNGATVAVIFSAVEALEANKAVQAIRYLGNTSTAPTPTSVINQVGSSGSIALNGSSKLAASIDHQHYLDQTLITNVTNSISATATSASSTATTAKTWAAGPNLGSNKQYGTNPTYGTAPLINYTFSAVVATTTGSATVTFPVALSNSIVGLNISMGYNGSKKGATASLDATLTSLSSCKVWLVDNTGALITDNNSYRVNITVCGY